MLVFFIADNYADTDIFAFWQTKVERHYSAFFPSLCGPHKQIE